jgi:hypothetical protein
MKHRHARVVQTIGEQCRITCGGEDVAHLGRGQRLDDRRVTLPPLDHQVRGNGPVGELAHPAQIGAPLGGQGLDHAHAAAF